MLLHINDSLINIFFKYVAIYKADQIISLRVPVRVLCIAMEVAIVHVHISTIIVPSCTVLSDF